MYDNAAEFITDLFPLVTILLGVIAIAIPIAGIVAYFELGWRIERAAEPIVKKQIDQLKQDFATENQSKIKEMVEKMALKLGAVEDPESKPIDDLKDEDYDEYNKIVDKKKIDREEK